MMTAVIVLCRAFPTHVTFRQYSEELGKSDTFRGSRTRVGLGERKLFTHLGADAVLTQ